MLYSELFQITENLNSLAYFIVNEVENESKELKISNLKISDLKISDLKTKTDNLLQLVRKNENKIRAIESLLSPTESYEETKYLAGSKLSAVNKGHEVLKKLNDLNIDISNYGFISLGGGDGTELYTEIENSKANFGLLLEYDFGSVNEFLKNKIPFKLKNYNRWNEIDLQIIECDLFDKTKLDITKEIIKSKNLDGIVVSIHAVLHELSTRSQLKSQFINENRELILEEFFREIYEWHHNIIIIIREPGIAENWNSHVYISISEQYKTDFLKILEEIDNIHFNGTANRNFRYREEQNQIRCKSDLAIEALTKFFYKEDYQYEKREMVTSVSREKIVTALQAGKELYTVLQTEPFFTGSVQANMIEFGIRVTGENNLPLPNPQCFTYTVASKGTHVKNGESNPIITT